MPSLKHTNKKESSNLSVFFVVVCVSCLVCVVVFRQAQVYGDMGCMYGMSYYWLLLKYITDVDLKNIGMLSDLLEVVFAQYLKTFFSYFE